MKTLREYIDLVSETSGQRFKVYYADIEYGEDNYEKILPSEFDLDEVIVVADNVQEAIKKFKSYNPDSYIDSVESIDDSTTEYQELEEVATPEAIKQINDLYNDK